MGEEEEEEDLVNGEAGVGADGKKKKNKKKKKKAGGEEGTAANGEAEEAEGAGLAGMDSKLLSQHIARLSVAGQMGSSAMSPAELGKHHAFWETQPMRRPDERPDTGGPIEPTDKEVRVEPYNLPAGFEWFTCNVDDDQQVPSRLASPPSSTHPTLGSLTGGVRTKRFWPGGSMGADSRDADAAHYLRVEGLRAQGLG